jgi:hypothetical protein
MTKMKAVDIQICTAALKVDHPELFHYTRPLSFEKILETQTLWSTYSGDLDDKKEISTLKPLLLQCVAGVFNQEVKTRDTGRKNCFTAGAAASRTPNSSSTASTRQRSTITIRTAPSMHTPPRSLRTLRTPISSARTAW